MDVIGSAAHRRRPGAHDIRTITVALVVVLVAAIVALLFVPGHHASGAAPQPATPSAALPSGALPTTQLPPITNPLEVAVEGHVVRRFHWGGYIREYRYHLPQGQVPTKPVPIIVMLHGYLLDDGWAERSTGFDDLSDKVGAIVVYPQGLANSWNAGGCCAQAQRLGSPDVDFIHAVVADMASRFQVDRHRVIVGGFSNGGMLTYQLACAASDQLAGVLIVNGSRQIVNCRPEGPLPMVVLHSRGDKTVPFNGQHYSKRLETGTPSVAASLEPFIDEDDCQRVSVAVAAPWESRLYRSCSRHSEITLLVNEVLSHQYPKDHTLPNKRSVAELAWSRLGPKTSLLPFADPIERITE